MEMGMLWKDDHPHRTLAQKVARGAEYFRRKYGQQPTVCFVHPAVLPAAHPGASVYAAGLRLLAARTVPIDHFWLGINAAATTETVALQEVTL